MDAVRLAPENHRVLLVGPRVVHLKPFFVQRRYQVEAASNGLLGMDTLQQGRFDVVLLEINLGDLTAAELLMSARQSNAQASFLLLDDPNKAGQIVKTMQAGLDGYVPTPPDEARLFFEVDRHLQRHAQMRATGAAALAAKIEATPPPLSRDDGKEIQRLNAELAAADARVRDVNARAKAAEQRVHALSDEGTGLREELEKVRAASEGTGLPRVLEGLIDGETVDDTSLSVLRSQLQNARDVSAENEGLKDELNVAKGLRRDLSEEIESLRRRLDEAQRASRPVPEDSGAILAARAKRIDLLESENHALSLKLRAEEQARLSAEKTLRAAGAREPSPTRPMPVLPGSIFESEPVLTVPDGPHPASLLRDLDLARAERDAATERAVDLELQLDELRERVSQSEQAVREREDRMRGAELHFRQERMRLIEEKEEAASGRQQTLEALDRRQQELEATRRHASVLEERVADATERLAALDAHARLRSVEGHTVAATADEVRGQLRDAEARLQALEPMLAKTSATLRERDHELKQAKQDALAAVNSTAGRLFDLEQAQLRHSPALEAANQRARTFENELLEARKRIRELADEASFGRSEAKPPQALVEERDRLRARLAEGEQWIAQAQPHIEALRVDRERLAAQIVTLTADLQRRVRETKDAHQETAAVRAQMENLTSQSLALDNGRPHDAGDAVLEATEPLRWGLTAALEYLATLETKAPQLSVHLRHLRLLEATLARLAES